MLKEPFHEKLPVRLSATERDQRSREASSRSVAWNRDKEVEKKRAKEIGDGLKSEEAAIGLLNLAADTGVEEQQVECVEVADYATERVNKIRLDTEEMCGSREMTPEERKQARQGELPGIEHLSSSRTARAMAAATIGDRHGGSGGKPS